MARASEAKKNKILVIKIRFPLEKTLMYPFVIVGGWCPFTCIRHQEVPKPD
jgi:hypothetical protein